MSGKKVSGKKVSGKKVTSTFPEKKVDVTFIRPTFIRPAGVRMEMAFAICALIGGAVMWLGVAIDRPVLSASSLLLCGWVSIPILVLPPLMLWRLIATCRRWLASRVA